MSVGLFCCIFYATKKESHIPIKIQIPYPSCEIYKMVSFVEIKGFDNFATYSQSIDESGPPVFFYFSGSKTPDGNSWCPDCVEAEPIVKAYLTELKKSVIFVYVDVGDREYWKDKACPFRTDNRCRLMVIPTILRWRGVQRLEGSQCNNRDLLQMMFEEDE